jgi:hypothetical protein
LERQIFRLGRELSDVFAVLKGESKRETFEEKEEVESLKR